MYYDKQGNVSFVDRIGDSFRWKGENVSTIEIEDHFSRFSWIEEVCVYGVEVTGCEGRAGMALIRVKGVINWNDIKSIDLPSYANPLFLRFTENEILKTGTYKFSRITFKKQGFDPSLCKGDSLYFRNDEEKIFPDKKYIEINEDIYTKIQNQEIKV